MRSDPRPVREDFPVEVTGAASRQDRQYAVDKVRSLAPYAAHQVQRAHVTLGKADASRSWRPGRMPRVRAAATLDVNGRSVHARASGGTAREAVDRLRRRLYAQLAWRRRSLRAGYAWVSRPRRRP